MWVLKILKPAQQQGAPLDDIFTAIKQAGHQLVADGKMKEETLAAAARDIIPRDEVIKIMQGQYTE